MMVSSHEKVLAMNRKWEKEGANAKVRAAAKKTADAVSEHLAMAKKLKTGSVRAALAYRTERRCLAALQRFGMRRGIAALFLAPMRPPRAAASAGTCRFTRSPGPSRRP